MALSRHPFVRIVLYLIIIAAACYFLFLSPGALRAHVKSILEGQLNADIALGAVTFNPLSGFTLKGISVRRDAGGDPIFKAERLRLRPRWSALPRLKFEIAELSLQDANLTYLKGPSGESNWSGVLRRAEVPAGGRPPLFSLRNGSVTIGSYKFLGLNCEITPFPSEKIIAVRGTVDDPFWGKYLIDVTLDRMTETVRISFEGRQLHITEEWVRRFPLVGEDTWEKYRPAGLFDLTGTITHCWGPERKTDYNLLFTATDASCRYLVFPVASATGRVFIDPHSVIVNNLRGGLFGGRVEGYSIANLDAPCTYFNRYSFNNVDMGEFLKDFQTSPASLSGSASGWVEFQGDYSLDTYTGSGELSIPDARLWKFPVILSILSRMQYSPDKGPEPVQDCKIVYTLSEDGFVFEEISLVSDVIDIYGEGRSGMDGELDLTLYVRLVSKTPILFADLLLQPALDSISGSIAQFGITGTLRKPRVRLIPFSPLSTRIINFFDTITKERLKRGPVLF